MDGEFGDLWYRCSPERAAVVVIDVQRDFCFAGAKDASEPTPEVKSVLERLDSLLSGARAAGVPVVFVKTIHDTASDAPEWRSRKGLLAPYGAESCRPGTGGEDLYGVAPEADEPLVIKHRYDAFVGTSLDELLRSSGRSSLLFTGLVTDVCVETSLRHAVCLDYLATLVSDCCGAFTPENQEEAVTRVRRSFGLAATSEEVRELWLGSNREGPAPLRSGSASESRVAAPVIY